MIDEGTIKYRCEWIEADAVSPQEVADLTCYRDALRQLNFIGEYPDGVGFGNISQRIQPTAGASISEFIISGTQTGSLDTLSAADYARVTHFDAQQNCLTCQGLRKASSESLTHGIIYASHPAIGAVIHVHHPQLWTRLLHQVPTTQASIRYGTPEMAEETQRLFSESHLLQQKIFVMAGHAEGIVTFGKTLQTAYRVLINWGAIANIFTPQASAAALQLPHQRA